MKIKGKNRLKIDEIELDSVEEYLKRCWHMHPERHLDIPQEVDVTNDITDKIDWTTIDRKSDIPTTTYETDDLFDEGTFFANKNNVSFVRHPRYTPSFWHTHEFFEIAFVLTGNCTNYICNKKIELSEGDICIMAPGVRHAISVFSDNSIILNITIRNSTFDKAFLGLISNENILSSFFTHAFYEKTTYPYIIFHCKGDVLLKQHLEVAYSEYYDENIYREQIIDNYISIFFIILLRNHREHMEIPETHIKSSDEVTIDILQYMQENYTTVSLQELVKQFHYSRRQIERIIQNSTGMGFRENIQVQKIAKTKEYLMMTDFSITQICEITGFPSQNNFRKIFKKSTGLTPSAYRKIVKQNPPFES